MSEKIESIFDLVDAIVNNGADCISVMNKADIDNEYILAYQFWMCSSSLYYLAFVNKETHEIDYFSVDLGEPEFQGIFDNWDLEVNDARK